MAVDFFLIDAPHVVPVEFAAWRAAETRFGNIVMRWCDAKSDAEKAALDCEGRVVKAEVDRLLLVARRAWLQASRP